MIERKMSLTPRGNLADKLKNIFVGEGTEIKISGKYYTLRESGMVKGDSMREPMLMSLKREAINYRQIKPCGFTLTVEVNESSEKGNIKEIARENYDYSIRFVREKISRRTVDQNTTYVIVNSEPYQVFQSSGNPISNYEIGLHLNLGRNLINAIFEGKVKNSGKPPVGVELRYGKNIFESITLDEKDLQDTI